MLSLLPRVAVAVNSTVSSMSTARPWLLMVLLVSIAVLVPLSLVSLSIVVSTSACTTPSSLLFSSDLLKVTFWLRSCSVGALPLVPVSVRILSIPFVVEMLVAMLSTKIAMYLGTSPLPMPSAPPKTGLWAVLHEIRSEYAQLMSVAFLLLVGPGPWSIDALAQRKRTRQD